MDTDLRFTEVGKKRSMSNEPSESEPSQKRNRSEADLYEETENSEKLEKRLKMFLVSF